MNIEKCIICGICSKHGIIVMNKKICANCEERIKNISMDNDFYEHYFKRIRKHIALNFLKE